MCSRHEKMFLRNMVVYESTHLNKSSESFYPDSMKRFVCISVKRIFHKCVQGQRREWEDLSDCYYVPYLIKMNTPKKKFWLLAMFPDCSPIRGLFQRVFPLPQGHRNASFIDEKLLEQFSNCKFSLKSSFYGLTIVLAY